MKHLYTCLFLVFQFVAFSQNTVEGVVLSLEDGQPLPFAHIKINGEKSLGTITDIDGKFSFSHTQSIYQIECSYLGFEPYKTLTIKPMMVINLEPSAMNLSEVVLRSKDNPALRIMRLAIQNKEGNNPEKYSSFSYTSYTKTVVDFRNMKSKNDSLKVNTLLKGGHIMMMESVTERKFKQPNHSDERVLATKVSGFKDPKFATLATDFQPFAFYNDEIVLFDVPYLNPLTKSGLSKYDFRLEDTFVKQNDTVFVISYTPKKGRNIEGLKGFLHINSHRYALQHVSAEPFEKGKINLSIQQKYQRINEHWFPEQLSYSLHFAEYPTKEMPMMFNSRSYIDAVQIDVPLQKRDFAIERVSLTKGAGLRSQDYWQHFRKDTLNFTEQVTYKVWDSLGEKLNFDKISRLTEKLTDNKIPLGKLDLDINRTLVYNRYEGFRLGLGLSTNERISEKFIYSAYGGYGLRDYDWKYGGAIQYRFHPEKEGFTSIHALNDLVEVGNYNTHEFVNRRMIIRDFIGFRMDLKRELQWRLHGRLNRSLQGGLTLIYGQYTPMYDYVFLYGNEAIASYQQTRVQLRGRWAPGEKIVQTFGRRVALTENTPVIEGAVTRGLQLNQEGFDFWKVELGIEQSFRVVNLGKTTYRAEIGYIDSALPYGQLFTGEGAYAEGYPYFMKFKFQTLLPYEFLSDRYARLFFIHNFGTLLMRNKLIQPSFSIHHNMGWGNLAHSNGMHQGVSYQIPNEIMMESGLQIDNILKFNYVNIGYLGMGVAVFHRHGAYANTFENKPWTYTLTATFSIK